VKHRWNGLLSGFCTRASLAVLVAIGIGGVAPASAAPLLTFEWTSPTITVSPGTSSVLITLRANQSDGADAAGITLGFSLADIVTGVSLDSFGSLVSEDDSFFGMVSGNMAMIAVAPLSPGSFGVDVDFDVVTLVLSLDTNLAASGTVGLTDLSTLLGPPVLEEDGYTEIDADLSAVQVVLVPEPSTATLLAASLSILGAGVRRTRRARLHSS
jgi:hypothetical protein